MIVYLQNPITCYNDDGKYVNTYHFRYGGEYHIFYQV